MEAPALLPPAPDDEVSRAASHADDPRKWWALAVILLVQLMIVLDIAVVNVAVASIQEDLGMAARDAPWIVTSYVLPFGTLLLLGGRIADYVGRKRVFCVATVGFAAASMLGGCASSPAILFGARALQGAFAAAMAPAALSLLSLGFPSGSDRARAFAAFGGVAAAAASLGVLAGGALTDYLSWRWCLLINVPVSVLAVVAAVPLLRESRVAEVPRWDVGGTVLGGAGLLAVIFGTTRVADHGWGDTAVLGCLATGGLLLAALPVWERRMPDPLVPFAIFRHRERAAALIAMACVAVSTSGLMLLILVQLQQVEGQRPIEAGLSYLPYPAAALLFAPFTPRAVSLLSARVVLTGAALVTAAGCLLATRMGPGMTYTTDLLPAMLLLGAGTAPLYVIGNSLSLSGVAGRDAGVASAVVSTIAQVGIALGVALGTSVAAAATRSRAASDPADALQAIAHGGDVACVLAAALALALGLGAAVVAPPVRRATRTGWPRLRRRRRAAA